MTSSDRLTVDTEKLSEPVHSEDGTSQSICVPVSTAQLELEKGISETTEYSTPSQQSDRVIRTAADWDGPDDPENPMNWPIRRKIFHTLIPAMQCFVITFGSSVYTPSKLPSLLPDGYSQAHAGAPQVAAHFNVSLTAALLPLSLYILGVGFGPMISAPISERWGRKYVYLILFPISLLFTVGAGFSQTFASMVICRFFAGLLGSGCLAVGAGTNSDMFIPLYRATTTACFAMAPFAGPALGPAMGGYVAMHKGWRWTQWLIVFWGVVVYTLTLFGSETYSRIILQARAKRLSIPGPPDKLPPGMSKTRFILVVTLLRPSRMLVTESIVISFSIYTAFNFSVLFAFFVAFPIVFRSPYPEVQVYHFDTGQGGLVFFGLGLGCLVATIIFIVMDRRIYRRKTLALRARGDYSHLPPEERLYPAMVGSFLLPVGLFWFAWTARSDVHWISPVLATIPFGIGSVLVFCSCILYLMDTYGPLAGASAAAANGLLRYILGAVFPLFTVQM